MPQPQHEMSGPLSSRLRSGIRVVLLDAVGTALTLSRSVAECYGEVAKRVGIDLPQDVIKSRFPGAFERNFTAWQSGLPADWVRFENDWRNNIESLSEWLKSPATRAEFASRFSLPVSESREYSSWASLVAEVLTPIHGAAPPAVLDEAFQILWSLFAAPETWRLMSGVTDLVAKLQGLGLRVCLASNFDGRLHQIMAGFSRDVRFDAIFVSSEIGYRKPDPRFYQEVLSRLGQPAEAVVMVGDRWWEDFAAPTTVGLTSFLFQPDPDRSKIHSTDHRPECLQSLTDLLA